MPNLLNIHKTFASYFPGIEPWAYAVSEALEQGSICLDVKRYKHFLDMGLAKNLFLESPDELKPEDLAGSEHVSTDTGNIQRPFIFENDSLYLQRYFVYQTRIVEKIKLLVENEKVIYDARKLKLLNNAGFINRIFPGQDVARPGNPEEVNWQKIAALNTCLNNFSIITGGPGTGKTTTVAKILAILFHKNPELKVALAAPTGKAAARMGESLNFAKESLAEIPVEIKKLYDNIVPRTIHRLLGPIHESTFFRHNAENPLPHDLIIIDEASMIDSALMYKLLEAAGPEKQIVLLGDKNQLASVEAGSIFGDLCRTQGSGINNFSESRFKLLKNSFNINLPDEIILDANSANILSDHVTQLIKNYRSESPEINAICRQIIENKPREVLTVLNNRIPEREVILDKNYDDKTLEDWVTAYKEYILEKDVPKALQKLRSFRVLCAVREGKHGIYSINKRIEEILKVQIDDPGLFMPSRGFYHNQLIMVTANNYDLGVFNGDTGLVRRKSENDNTLMAYFESSDPEKPIAVQPAYLNNYETVLP